jgi:hypothetical protein
MNKEGKDAVQVIFEHLDKMTIEEVRRLQIKLKDDPEVSNALCRLMKHKKKVRNEPRKPRGCNLCAAHASAAKKGLITETYECGCCLTQYKVQKVKNEKAKS